MSGHLKRDCRYRYPRNDGEAHGRKDHGNEACGRKDPPVANVSRAEDASPVDPPKKKIEDIRWELREAELAAAVNDAAGIIRNVEGVSNTLGPTITARVEVNGVSTNALVDTGSPATIISLEFIAMEVMTKERNQYSSVDKWKIGTTKKFTPPEVALKNYGGGRLDITAQIMLCITQGDACAELQSQRSSDGETRSPKQLTNWNKKSQSLKLGNVHAYTSTLPKLKFLDRTLMFILSPLTPTTHNTRICLMQGLQ